MLCGSVLRFIKVTLSHASDWYNHFASPQECASHARTLSFRNAQAKVHVRIVSNISADDENRLFWLLARCARVYNVKLLRMHFKRRTQRSTQTQRARRKTLASNIIIAITQRNILYTPTSSTSIYCTQQTHSAEAPPVSHCCVLCVRSSVSVHTCMWNVAHTNAQLLTRWMCGACLVNAHHKIARTRAVDHKNRLCLGTSTSNASARALHIHYIV